MKKCPFCAEEIQDEAIKCKHCGESVSGLVSAQSDMSAKMGKEAIKRLSETKCTCNSCQHTWYYGMKDVTANISSSFSNVAASCDDLMRCPCCGGSAPKKKVIDLDKCPKCGSRNIKKETVIHEVST